mgnify:CR=1 FL=1
MKTISISILLLLGFTSTISARQRTNGEKKNIAKAEALIEQALAHCKKVGSSDYPCNTMDAKGELFWLKKGNTCFMVFFQSLCGSSSRRYGST